MPRYLAIDAEQSQLYLTAASVKGSIVTVEKAVVLSDAGALTAANASEIGRRLKDMLREADIAPAPVLISVGRERVILKEVKYPATVTGAEEPALVRFQVAKELAEGGDAVVIDYFVLPTLDPDGQRRALAFAIRKDVLAPLKNLCSAAGLKLVGITPRPFGIGASLLRAIKDGAVTPPEAPAAPTAILVRGDKWGELVILRAGQVAFSRSLTGMALSNETAMLGEIRRNLAVFAGTSAANAVQALFVAEGDMPGGWAGRLRASLTIPVQAFDPVAGTSTSVAPEIRGSFSGPVGILALRAKSAELPINFLEPREPKPVRDPGKRMLALVGIAAALLLLGGLAIGLFVVNQQSNKVSAYRIQKNDLEEDIKKLDDSTKRVKAVKEWESKGINWLDELYDLTARFPDPATTEVVQLIGKPFDPGKNSKVKHVADMELTIHTGSVKAIDALTTDMAHDRHYSVAPKQSKGATGPFNGGKKNEQYLFKAAIEQRGPSAYTLRLNTPPPIATKGSRAGVEKGSGTFSAAEKVPDPFSTPAVIEKLATEKVPVPFTTFGGLQ